MLKGFLYFFYQTAFSCFINRNGKRQIFIAICVNDNRIFPFLHRSTIELYNILIGLYIPLIFFQGITVLSFFIGYPIDSNACDLIFPVFRLFLEDQCAGRIVSTAVYRRAFIRYLLSF